MTTFKLVVSDPKDRKAYQLEVDKKASALVGKRIGDAFDGGFMGLAGYKLQITGGSDQQGFPMRKDVEGMGRKKVLLSFGPGFHPRMKGQRKRKNVRGNTVSLDIAQVNAKIVEYGKEPIAKLLGKETKQEKVKPAKETQDKEQKPAKEAGGKPEAGAKKTEGKTEEKAEGKEVKDMEAEKPK